MQVISVKTSHFQNIQQNYFQWSQLSNLATTFKQINTIISVNLYFETRKNSANKLNRNIVISLNKQINFSGFPGIAAVLVESIN